MGTLGYLVLGLCFVLVLAALFGFIANRILKRSSPEKRAGIASAGVGILITIPAFVALLSGGVPIVAIAAVAVVTVVFAAVSFPVALYVTRKKPAEVNPATFD